VASHSQQCPRQTLLALVEELVANVFFKGNVAREELRQERFRQRVLLVQCPDQLGLLNLDSDCCRDADLHHAHVDGGVDGTAPRGTYAHALAGRAGEIQSAACKFFDVR